MLEKYSFHDHSTTLEKPKMDELKRNLLEKLEQKVFIPEYSIGRGQTAKVYQDPLNNVCYKVIYNEDGLVNGTDDEANILEDLYDSHPYVRTPEPLFTISAVITEDKDGKPYKRRVKALAMERVKGYSVDDMINNPELIPSTLDLEHAFSQLEDFFQKMHEEKRVYHRDFHAGNLMFETETGRPYVIDFGLAERNSLSGDDPYKSAPDIKGNITVFPLRDDQQIMELKDEVESILTK